MHVLHTNIQSTVIQRLIFFGASNESSKCINIAGLFRSFASSRIIIRGFVDLISVNTRRVDVEDGVDIDDVVIDDDADSNPSSYPACVNVDDANNPGLLGVAGDFDTSARRWGNRIFGE